MQLEIKDIQQCIGATVIFVTHDQEEALAMSDRIAVMHGGRILQVGTPKELYNEPDSLFVASFLGNLNLIDGRVESVSGASCLISAAGSRHETPISRIFDAGALRPGDNVQVAVRPERLIVGPENSPEMFVKGRIHQQVFNGATVALIIDYGTERSARLHAVADAHGPPAAWGPGDIVAVGWNSADARYFGRAAP